MTLRREKRLREAGLLEVTRLWLSPEEVLLATARGPGGLRPPRTLCGQGIALDASPFSVLAHLAADLESAEEQRLSERELL